MRMFQTCAEALNEVTRDVFSRGVKSYDRTVQSIVVAEATHGAKELVGYDYAVCQPTMEQAKAMIEYAKTIFNKEHFTAEYAEDWLREMITGGLNPGDAHMKHWPDYWNKYSLVPKTGKFAYTYSERLQLPLKKVIELLKDNRYRRAAFAPVWNDCDINLVGEKRIPCSIGYHFLIRKEGATDQLHLIYMQRSCSLAEFFPFDMYRAVGLQHYVAEQLGVEVGNLMHFISSLHCFYKDLKDTSRVW